jgi:hypothetical protein
MRRRVFPSHESHESCDTPTSAVRVLFDQGVPRPLSRALRGHDVSTAYQMGWSTLKNGELLNAADSTFEVLITTDQSLRYQQNLVNRRLAILVLSTTNWPRIEAHMAHIAAILDNVQPGDCLEITVP